MGKPAPFWKGKILDRDLMRSEAEHLLRQCARGDVDEEIGRWLNRVEVYLGAKILEHSIEVLEEAGKGLNEAIKAMKDWLKALNREEIKRAAQAMREEEEEDADDDDPEAQ